MSTPTRLGDLLGPVADDLADRYDPTDLITPSPLQGGGHVPAAPLQGPPGPSAADLTGLADRVQALRYAQAKADEWKKTAEEIKAELQDAMGGADTAPEVAVVDGRPVARWTRVKSNRFNQSAFKRADPGTYALYVEVSESRRFTLVDGD